MADMILVVLVLGLVGFIVHTMIQKGSKKPREKGERKEKFQAKRKEIIAKAKVKVPEPINCQMALLLDTTSSMGSEIMKCKNNLENLVDRINQMASGETGREFIKLEVGFVPYKDHGDHGHLQGAHPLSYDVASVKAAIQACSASGGADLPEDMRGGFETALGFNWNSDPKSMKVMCVIADAPCHGTQFNGGAHDNYPNDSPKMLTTLQRLVDKNISLLVSHITKDTKVMSGEFKQFYQAHKPSKVKGQMGIACMDFDLNRAFDDEAFTEQLVMSMMELFNGNVDPAMLKGLGDAKNFSKRR